MIPLLYNRKRLLRLGFLWFVFALAAVPAGYAQVDFSGTDLSDVKVEDLSDEQLEGFIEQMDEHGFSIDEIEKLALARGMQATEAYKLKARIRQLQAERGSRGVTGRRFAEPTRDDPADEAGDGRFVEDDPFFQLLDARYTYLGPDQEESAAEADSAAERIFGERLFRVDELTFAPSLNMATPENYQLGSGDELMIDVWGAAQITYQATVSREGTIILENLGPIFVNGLTIEEAERRIVSRLSQLYAGLSLDEASPGGTYADVSLSEVRSIRIHVIGEVEQPGTYTIPSLSTVLNALYVCGGPSENGTYRKIQVIRGGGVIAELDVYDFLVYGDQTGNIRLLDQDYIKVDPYLARVAVRGQVKRPLLFEVKPEETLADVLRFAGSFTGDAYTRRLRIHRNTDTEKRLLDVTNGEFARFDMQNGDAVFVDKILNRFENRVEIRGAVYRAGEYELTDASTVYQLIQKAEGLKGDALLTRAQIYRTQPDLSVELISFDLAEVLEDPASNDVALQKDDVVVIPSALDLREEYNVEIGGSVQAPGVYPYMENMTLEDLIVMAQGLKDEASLLRVEVSRRQGDGRSDTPQEVIAETFQLTIDENLRIADDGSSFTLMPFDKVFVFRSPNYTEQQDVRISGEVLFPGTYTIQTKSDRISDLIQRAGGLTSEAYPRGAVLVRSQSTAGPVGINLEQILDDPASMHDLLVTAGDSIHVPRRLQTIQISGAVYRPVSVRYVPGLSVRDYINRAGGPTDQADIARTYVVYANGSVDRVRDRFLFFDRTPRMEPGAEIVIPARPPDAGLSTQERMMMFSGIASITAVLTTALIQIIQLGR